MKLKALLKNVMCVGAVCALVLSFTGCKNKEAMIKGEELGKVPAEPYEINWYIQSPSQKDVSLVEEKVNEYLKDKINATLKINILESSQYEKKMGTMIAAGEAFDIAFTCSWLLNYATYANDGAFFDLTDYTDTYLKEAIQLFDEDYLKSAYIDGRLYALPTLKEIASQKGWVYRKDIAEKYNLNMADYKNFEELEPVLKMIKEKEPSIQYPIDWTEDRTAFNLNDFYSPVADVAIFFENGKARDKVENIIESDIMKKSAAISRRFYLEGLVNPDVLTSTNITQRFQEGKTFVYMENLKPGKAEETYRGKNIPVAQVGITPIYKTDGLGSMNAVSSTSKNPYRAMRFLNLLYTDPVLSNLIVYGVEGVHYTKIDENRVDVPENTGYSLANIQWMFGNVFNNYLAKSEDPEKHKLLKEFNEAAMPTPVRDLTITIPQSLDVQKMAVTTVKKQYRKQLVLGAVDPEQVIDQYISELKAAGIDELIAECQRQYDEWKAKQ